jgi:Domain of unknown function (DUF4375)
MDDAARRAWDRLLDRIDRDGYESLNAREAAWVSVRSLIDTTQGGGLISYFYSTAADHLEECRAALRWLKQSAVLDCLDRAAELFPEDSLGNVETRAEAISAWSDDDDEIDATLEDIDDELRDLFDGLEEKLDRFVMEDPRDDDWSE